MKKPILLLLLFYIAYQTPDYAQMPRLQGDWHEMIAAPVDPRHPGKWLDSIKQWRINERVKINYNDKEYLRPELGWIKTTFIYAQMMAHDLYFYDPETGKYTVDRYLDDVQKRYGGLDAVLIWPTYPNIGVDNRNQFDMTADMPGGKEAIKQMIRDFHRRGVRVFFPIMIWDKGTHKHELSIARTITREMKELGADGLNGDTMSGVTKDFYDAYTENNYAVALQPEINMSDLKMVEWNRMSWGYYWAEGDESKYDYKPGVSLYKWLEPRHQVSITNRWAVNKTNDLQYAFFNGIGYNAWENIWGIWNQVPQRYAEAMRRIRMIYRQFPDVWSSKDWQPYFPVVQQGVFASKFPGAGETVYTLINRDSTSKPGVELILPYIPNAGYFDVWNGVKLSPKKNGNTIGLTLNIEGNGYGAVLELDNGKQPAGLRQFLAGMKKEAIKPLKTIPADWKPLSQRQIAINKTAKFTQAPDGMVLIPGTGSYNFKTDGVMIEGEDLPDANGIQYPWESYPQKTHKKTIIINSFYIDRYPVTNKQFKQFLQATAYHPKDDHNFLKYWKDGNYPGGWDDKPVTWVSLEDARAYAAWAGKRLPHEWEWQYAAQGTDGRAYPWGAKRDTTLIPPPDTSRNMREPSSVTAYPKGASPFGIMDMTGNIWQWTDEYIDEHTRSAVLKGGSYYHAQTSGWYFPQAQEVNKYGKYLLMSPGMDRAATIGFRCVADR